ncbi:protein kinase [Streptomyces albidoflavus]|uniref:protein kinase domain-containing protein n=1 Tax=Streptomyces albidoflavus TaxID=1886 RepID=UPI0033ACA656
MKDTAPDQLPEGAEAALPPRAAELVLHRRGSTVWKVTTERGVFAVKAGRPVAAYFWTGLAPGREAAVLRQLSHEDIHDGKWAGGTWNAQPWHPGTSLYDLWAHHRTGERPPRPSFAEARACAAALAELHEQGWVHGDVQPAHLLLDGRGAALVDLSLATGGQVPPEVDFAYRGCLVHYEAPEIAQDVLEQGTATPTRASDVYALGASLMVSATGWRHVAYPDDASREEQRRAIVRTRHRPVTVAGPMGKLIEAMLRRDPADRPTSAEVRETLYRQG